MGVLSEVFAVGKNRLRIFEVDETVVRHFVVGEGGGEVLRVGEESRKGRRGLFFY